MNKEEQRTFLQYVFRRMKELHRELTIYRTLVQVMQDEGFPAFRVAAILKEARKSEEVQAATDKWFARFDELIEQAAESGQDQALLKLLERYKPDGEPN
jgi:hypothetical protein